MSDKVYLLWFVPKEDVDEEDALLIGVYREETDARAAIERLRIKPGFVDYPAGFRIYDRDLGRDYWTEGFAGGAYVAVYAMYAVEI